MGCESRAVAAWWAAAAILGAAGLAAEDTWSDAAKEDFLRRAEILRSEELSIGVTRSRRATLSLNGRIHDAHIQTVDVERAKVRVGRQIRLNFRDCYRYNVAAYRLDRMLGLRMVPVSVERTVERQKAAVTWWVDDVLMMEKDREERGIRPPYARDWMLQSYRRRVFNELVYNTDFNQGNLLITRGWKMWLVDFTRAFRGSGKLYFAPNLMKIEHSLLERLRALTREQIEGRLGDVLTRREQRAILARRDAILEHFAGKVAREGEDAVFLKSC